MQDSGRTAAAAYDEIVLTSVHHHSSQDLSAGCNVITPASRTVRLWHGNSNPVWIQGATLGPVPILGRGMAPTPSLRNATVKRSKVTVAVTIRHRRAGYMYVRMSRYSSS